MKYQLILFDFDGTLANSFPWFATIINQLADRFHFKRIDPSEYDMVRGFNTAQMLQHVGLPVWKIPTIGSHLNAMIASNIHQIPLFEGVDEMLGRLAEQGVQMAILSSNAEDNIRRVLGPVNEARFHYFECGVALMGKASKIRKVLAKSQVQPHEALMVGDEIRDIEAAQSARIAAGAVGWGYNRLDVLRSYRPDEVFERMEEILERVV